MKESRREFIGKSCRALTMAAVATQMSHLGLVSALAQKRARKENAVEGYKALVCVFLNGGNDANNMVVPKYNAGYAQYSAARSAQGLAIAQGDLLPITPPTLGL